MIIIDITGQRFGRLVVLKRSKNDLQNRTSWLCQCDCGEEIVTSSNRLRRGETKSCGCYKNELIGDRVRTHGLSNSPEYHAWERMHSRCQPNHKQHKDYYDRGIRVCDRWKIFENFLTDMGDIPTPVLTLERIDNDLSYSPGNCCWASRRFQSLNQRIRCTNTTGVKGVSPRKNGTFRAKYNDTHLGYFKTVEEAASVRREAELNDPHGLHQKGER
jgi:hypothetical protein